MAPDDMVARGLTDFVRPREFAHGVYWLGGCLVIPESGEFYHSGYSTYLVVGDERSLLVDTGHPDDWPVIQASLDFVLGGRSLDFIVPTHPEVPHSGNLGRLLARYPSAIPVGDVRDYHLYYPEHESRLLQHPGNRSIDLGGREVTIVDALIKDVANTVWAYESLGRVLFTADAFVFFHHMPPASDPDAPLHTAAECRLLSSELSVSPEATLVAAGVRNTLPWAKYVDATPFFDSLEHMLERFPTRFVAPSHGNVIDDIGASLSAVRYAHAEVFAEARGIHPSYSTQA